MTHAIPLPDMSPLFVFRFWTHVEKSDGCWDWVGTRGREGYGRVKLGARLVAAHRVAYTITKGSIIGNLVIDHLCRNRACVNPDHLEAVTNHENILRGMAAGGGPGRPRASVCKMGHEFTTANTITVPKGKRCRECTVKYKRARYQERKARLAAQMPAPLPASS